MKENSQPLKRVEDDSFCRYFHSPIGELGVWVNSKNVLKRISFAGEGVLTARHAQGTLGLDAVRQLEEYFAGTRKIFELKIEPEGTPFRRSVWDLLVRVPYGSTTSYAHIARQLGNANACRAVGAANGANPIPIVIPCHRIIGSNGSLVGYAGGMDIKRTLLQHEGVLSVTLL